jgi:hypothetical protein
MARAFQAGDKVRCNRASCSGGRLTMGEIYTVSRVTTAGFHIVLEGRGHSFNADRFELVKEPRKARKAPPKDDPKAKQLYVAGYVRKSDHRLVVPTQDFAVYRVALKRAEEHATGTDVLRAVVLRVTDSVAAVPTTTYTFTHEEID